MTAGAVEGEDGTGTELELRYQREALRHGVWFDAADFQALLSWSNKFNRYDFPLKKPKNRRIDNSPPICNDSPPTARQELASL